MDELLDSSDGLHTEILALLQDAKAFPSIRHEVAMVACGMALEHALSLRLLVRVHCLTSALSLMRLQYEALARGVWLLYAATDLQVQVLASPLTVDAETSARKMPMFSTMLKQIVTKAPPQESRMLLNFKEVNWHTMNSFIHSGIHPLRRHAKGYPGGLIESAIRNCNGLSVMVLQLCIVLTGDARYKGVVRTIQEKHSQILPALISPLH